MVGARNKGEGDRRREKRGEVLFSSEGVRGGAGGRKGTGIKAHTTSFLPLRPPSLSHTRMPQRCQGAGFSVLFCLASSGLGSPARPPSLPGSAREGGKAVGTEAEAEGRHLRWLAPVKWRQ